MTVRNESFLIENRESLLDLRNLIQQIINEQRSMTGEEQIFVDNVFRRMNPNGSEFITRMRFAYPLRD